MYSVNPFLQFKTTTLPGIPTRPNGTYPSDITYNYPTWYFHFRRLQFNWNLINICCRYEQCSWGWKDSQKLEELTDEAAWYLIARSPEGTSLGFSHFRFDLDYGDEVLYW